MKSQAEIAGRLSSSLTAHPQKGTVLRDLELPLPGGAQRLLSAIRARANLVMIFTAGQDLQPLLNDVIALGQKLKENSAHMLVIQLGGQPDVPLTAGQPDAAAVPATDAILISSDPDGTVHRALGATDAAQNPIPTLYITDRFGEVFAAFRAHDPAALPNAQQIIEWLAFVSYQCEECSPPEWQE
jgi:hypothetical protein